MFGLTGVLAQQLSPVVDPTALYYCPHTTQNCYYTTTMSSDPHWNNVIIFLQGEGLNNGLISNEISDPVSNSLIVSGNSSVYLSNARAKYGSHSIFFNKLQSEILPKMSNQTFSISDFTFEFWAYVENAISGGTFAGLVGQKNNTVGTFRLSFLPNTGYFQTLVGNMNSPTTVCPTGQWFHYAVTRQGSSVRVFVNGILNHTGTSSTIIPISLTSKLRLGNGGGTTTWLNGYMDTIRFTNGIARYTTNFNPETDTYLNTTITRSGLSCSNFYT